jgi:hypothetical protein
MELTEELKKQIDKMSYVTLLAHLKFSPKSHALFQDESGQYFTKRINELRNAPGGYELHLVASKSLGF